MQPFQQRVIDEKAELDDRLTKLKSFWDNPVFQTLPDEEKQRLEKQSLIMEQYSQILGERIAAFVASLLLLLLFAASANAQSPWCEYRYPPPVRRISFEPRPIIITCKDAPRHVYVQPSPQWQPAPVVQQWYYQPVYVAPQFQSQPAIPCRT